jgi:hypothetical protein
MDVLLLRANCGNVFIEPLPSNDHIRHNIMNKLTFRGQLNISLLLISEMALLKEDNWDHFKIRQLFINNYQIKTHISY